MKNQIKSIILRDMIETDVDDYVRWFTAETEWTAWDAPWEPIDSNEAAQRGDWMKYYESVKRLSDNVVRWKFEIEYEGKHIGWVSSYLIDENYEWISADNIGNRQTYCAIGIDICEKTFWDNGIGTKALQAFIQYLVDNGHDELYTQTWSGNKHMLSCASKLGFEVCKRNVGEREINGEKYDGLTLRFKKKPLPSDMIVYTQEQKA